MATNRREGKKRERAFAICLGGLLSACATAPNTANVPGDNPDANVSIADAALQDASAPDSTILVDAGQTDARSPDASVDAAAPDAMLPDAALCTVGPLQLLTNGNFDTGSGTWVESSSGNFPIVVNESTVTGLTADTPSFVAWTGGYSEVGASDSLLQDFVVPGDATPISVSGKFRIVSEELGIIAFDRLKLQILDPANSNVLEEVTEWSNLDSNTAWENFTATVSGTYAGQTIRLRFFATMDISNNTSFFLDSVSADTTSCQ